MPSSINNLKRVPCIARADFFGDALLSQLSFEQNTPLKVDFRSAPHNGWRWGACGGQRGWLPDWAATPVSQQQMTPSHRSCSSRRTSHRRSKDCIVIMESITESLEPFDQRKTDILGGKAPDDSVSGRNPSPESAIPDAADSLSRSKWGIKNLFQKSRVDNNSSSSNNNNNNYCKNPYTQKQDQPEWDGSETPRIVSGVDGRVAVIEAEGHTSHYKNEKTYQIAIAANQIMEQVSTTTKKVGHKITTFKMPSMPKRSSGSTTTSNSNNNNSNTNNTTTGETQTKTPKQQVNIVANDSDSDNEQNPKESKFSMMKLKLLPKMPPMPKVSKLLTKSNKEGEQVATSYRNEHTMVEERKRNSRTRLDIHY